MFLIFPTALFLLLGPIALLVYFIWKKESPSSPRLLRLSAPAHIVQSERRRTRLIFRLLFLGTLTALVLMVFVVTRPATRHLWTQKSAKGVDIVVALDVSESMDADDFKPNRLTVAKSVINNFIERRSTDRIGLVTFGGEAVTKCPLTRDYDFLLQQLKDVKLRELKQGTAIGMALANSVGRLRASKSKNKVVVLITDGDSNVGAINPITAATLAQEESIRIYSIGIGKKSRVLVPIYAYDMYGNKTHLLTQVPSYLNPELLQEISRMTQAKSYMATDSQSLENILREIDRLEKSKVKVSPREKVNEKYFAIALIATLLLGMIYYLQETRFWRAKPRYATTS